jgi:hypothetical protein
MDIYTPEKCKKPLKNAQNGCIGGAGTRAFRITQ